MNITDKSNKFPNSEEKIERIVENYNNVFFTHPNIPIFILTENQTKKVNFRILPHTL